MKLISIFVAALLLTGCGVTGEANQEGLTSQEQESQVEQSAEKASLRDSCLQVAKEFQIFFQSDANFADSARGLALGLTIVSADAEELLAKNLDTFVELLRKVNSTVTTNSAFLALAQDKHIVARDHVFRICKGEGIQIN